MLAGLWRRKQMVVQALTVIIRLRYHADPGCGFAAIVPD